MKKVLTITQDKKRPVKVSLTAEDVYAEDPARGPRTNNTVSVIDGTKMTVMQAEKKPLRVFSTDSVIDVVNDLDSDATDKPLSAAMGKALKAGIDALAPVAMEGYATKPEFEELEESVTTSISGKADITGYYSTMASGSAEGLVGVPDAVGTLNGLPQDYISKASMDHILTAMVTAGVISAYTLTWNDLSNSYSCTITPVS